MKLLYAEDEPEAAAELMGMSIARAIMEGEGGSLSARVKPGGTIEFEARWKIART